MSNPYGYPPPQPYPGVEYQTQEVKLKHSGLGIASCIIAMLIGLIEVGSVILAAVLVSQHQREDSPVMELAGLGICGGVLIALLGAILGLIGLFAGRCKRVFPIIGLVLNILILLMIGGLLVVGLAAK